MAPVLSKLNDEFVRAEFGDKRLGARLLQIASSLAAQAGGSLPRAMRTSANLEAAYRFLSNPRVTPHAILATHVEATAQRAVALKTAVLVIHDTTQFNFSGESRQGLGRTTDGQEGFFAHVAFAVSSSGEPLGIIGLQTWVRNAPPPKSKSRKTYRYQQRTGKESDRWASNVDAASERIRGRCRMVHVMDREGDQYRVLSHIHERSEGFVIRGAHLDRLVVDDRARNLTDVLKRATFVLERTVTLSPRHAEPRLKSANPSRSARTCQLGVSATTVQLRRSWGIAASTVPPSLEVNAVRVAEVNPPTGTQPVEWILLTNLPIKTKKEVEFIVDCYRHRWQIEELFKAIKTGCQYERLQLESRTSLLNALALIVPIAWQMLLLRHLARGGVEISATPLLTAPQLGALRAAFPRLKKAPTAHDALFAIAELGGHIKNNGDPGWLVLYRGLRDLTLMAAGWSLKM